MPLGRELHTASRLQEWSRKEDSKNFSLMFRHDGDVVNFLMRAVTSGAILEMKVTSNAKVTS